MKKPISIFFISVLFILIVSTFYPQEIADSLFYQALWFKALWAVLSIGLFTSMASFIKKREIAFALICLGFIFVLLGGFLASYLGVEGFIEIKEGETVHGIWIEDDLFRPLDFSLFLKDFSVELYPKQIKGMYFVKSYKSSVNITRGKNVLKQGVIEVNKPLRFGGFNFYQYGYDVDLPHQTILQVVKDPGLPFVYVGYILSLVGMIFSFKKVFFSV